MVKPAMETYKHYKVVTHADGRVAVYDPRYPRNPSLYDTGTVESARRWVSAYRDGVTWAMQECLMSKPAASDDFDHLAAARDVKVQARNLRLMREG